MKKISNQSTYAIALLATLPLIMLAGCAGNDTMKFSGDTSLATTEVTHEVQAAELASEQSDIHSEGLGYEYASSVDTSIEALADNIVEMQEPLEAKADESIANSSVIPKPQEEIIGFAFDQSDVDSQYGELLWQHAQYLKQNSNLILHINGHTDNSGARVYNEMLSEKRAQQVAKILLEFGAPEERVKVLGNASDLPLPSAIHHREHRRVELDYQDQQIVSN